MGKGKVDRKRRQLLKTETAVGMKEFMLADKRFMIIVCHMGIYGRANGEICIMI